MPRPCYLYRFRSFDRNGDGRITLDELREGLTRHHKLADSEIEQVGKGPVIVLFNSDRCTASQPASQATGAARCRCSGWWGQVARYHKLAGSEVEQVGTLCVLGHWVRCACKWRWRPSDLPSSMLGWRASLLADSEGHRCRRQWRDRL